MARAGARQSAPSLAPAAQEAGLFGKLAAAFSVKPAEPAVDPAPVGSLRAERGRPNPAPPPRRPPDPQPLPEPGLPRLMSGAQQALSASLKEARSLLRFDWLD
jgi:hypothetical protein